MKQTWAHFPDLMRGVLSGSEDAARRLHDDYGPYVLRVIRQHLPAHLRQKLDSTDFTQAVWLSFFVDNPALSEIDTPDRLIAYLAGAAHHKVVDAIRHGAAAKRDIRREQRTDPVRTGEAGPSLVSRGPTPSEVAIAEETWRQLLDVLPPLHRRALLLTREGRTPEEIAEELPLSARTVRRLIGRVMERVQS